MGQRELLLLLGAITVFGTAALNLKRFIVNQNELMLQRQFESYAVALAQSFIEEAKGKSYDDRDTNPAAPKTYDFTAPAALGPEAGEIYPRFNDVDDYDGFTKIDSSGLGKFSVAIQVDYVEESDPNRVVNTQTFYKKMTVTVTHYFLDQPITLSSIQGYREN
ncbi:hypothetical protein HUU40_02350 [candidate division KSB1 bacterium]|nr:hypothetical protein [candidate division KSB1 bacterium]